MRLPCVRFTVRGMMVVVAAVAVSLGTWRAIERLRARASEYQLVAALHAWAENLHTHADKYEGACLGWLSPPFRANSRIDSKLAASHATLRRKYEYAASHPRFPSPLPSEVRPGAPRLNCFVRHW